MSTSQCQRGTHDVSSVIKEELNSDIPAFNVIGNWKAANVAKQETRATSPLDTIAEVACRIGTALPLNSKSRSKEEALPANAFGAVSLADCQEPGSESPTSIPTQETTSPFPAAIAGRREQSGQDDLISLHSLLRILRSNNLEALTNALRLGNNGDKLGRTDEPRTGMMAEKVCEDMIGFKDDVMTKIGNIMQEINTVKAEVASLQNTIECMQREFHKEQSCEAKDMENAGCMRRGHVLSVKPEDVGKLCLMVKRLEHFSEDKEMTMDEKIRIDGTELTIRVERRCLGKREVRSNDSLSCGSEAEERDIKKMKQMETRRELRHRQTGGESITGTDSLCNSDKSDWEYNENGSKRLRGYGLSGKGMKGKSVRRRRDNWTEEENKVFIGMVVGNQDVEEMTLRRMLARRFSPRRTHEQCANHLRILRAQKKLPPAREESVMKKEK